MSPTTSELLEFNIKEPIPGYLTTELIGRGGSGEVWRAVARRPRQGRQDRLRRCRRRENQGRAQGAVPASRTSGIRFSCRSSGSKRRRQPGHRYRAGRLQLEGILRRKTESRFQWRAAGRAVRYLNDAAEALDFLYGQYSLQHLDVKPENILLLSGRAKVGDFGLVKNLYERSNSIVGGLRRPIRRPSCSTASRRGTAINTASPSSTCKCSRGFCPSTEGTQPSWRRSTCEACPTSPPCPGGSPIIARALSRIPAQRSRPASP